MPQETYICRCGCTPRGRERQKVASCKQTGRILLLYLLYRTPQVGRVRKSLSAATTVTAVCHTSTQMHMHMHMHMPSRCSPPHQSKQKKRPHDTHPCAYRRTPQTYIHANTPGGARKKNNNSSVDGRWGVAHAHAHVCTCEGGGKGRRDG